MESSSPSAGTKDANVINRISNTISRSLEDGGSSIGLTQGEIIFVTLACFVVVIAAIFAIYSVYKKRRQAKSAQRNNSITRPNVMSPAIAMGNGMEHPAADINNSIVSRESIRNKSGYATDEERTRRTTFDSVNSTGGKQMRRASTGSLNVSKQYKVAAINQMRRMTNESDP